MSQQFNAALLWQSSKIPAHIEGELSALEKLKPTQAPGTFESSRVKVYQVETRL